MEAGGQVIPADRLDLDDHIASKLVERVDFSKTVGYLTYRSREVYGVSIHDAVMFAHCRLHERNRAESAGSVMTDSLVMKPLLKIISEPCDLFEDLCSKYGSTMDSSRTLTLHELVFPKMNNERSMSA